MNSYIRLDEGSKVLLETYKLSEQKLIHREHDGFRETNRNYIFYFVVKVIGEDDELWNNPFSLFDYIRVKRLIVKDVLKEDCIVFKLQSINKYQIDQAIDDLVMLVEGPGHYELIKKNNQTYSVRDTTIFDFVGFFKWNVEVIE